MRGTVDTSKINTYGYYGKELAEQTLESQKVGFFTAAWYLQPDEWNGIDFWGMHDAGALYEAGRGERYPSRWVGSKREKFFYDEEEDATWFWVDKYEHGQVHYSLRNTENYPDRRWDVSTGCIYVPPLDQQDALEKGQIDMATLRKYANSVLQEYSSWRNGDVYGIVSVVIDPGGDAVEEEAAWGFIGYKYAESEGLKEAKEIAMDMAKEADWNYRQDLIEEQKEAGQNFLENLMGQVGPVGVYV